MRSNKPKKFLMIKLISLGDKNVHNDHDRNEYEGKDRCQSAKELICGFALSFAKECFSTASDRTGKPLILARLHKNAGNENDREHQNYNAEYDFYRTHFKTSEIIMILRKTENFTLKTINRVIVPHFFQKCNSKIKKSKKLLKDNKKWKNIQALRRI